MNKLELIYYLDEYLDIKSFIEASKNGLQVDNKVDDIKKIWYAVDATTYIFDMAKQEGVDFLITHHGIFWWYEETLTGIWYTRAQKLIENNVALYAAHLPLDAHAEVWNNIGLVKAFVNIFGLREWEYEIDSFSPYNGKNIGFWVRFKKQLHISNIVTPYAEHMQLIKRLFNFSDRQYFTSIGFISGGALSYLDDALKKKYDVFVTWEWSHGKIIAAKEKEATILLAGHYETEKIWVKLLAKHLEKKFWVETVFLDEKY